MKQFSQEDSVNGDLATTMLVPNYYEKLHTTECSYEEPLIEDSRIVIPAHNVGIAPGHPSNSTDTMVFLSKCRLIFNGAKSSRRELYDYVEQPVGSKNFRAVDSPHIISDDLLLEVDELTQSFFIEGVMERPLAWVNWEIQSVSFCIEV